MGEGKKEKIIREERHPPPLPRTKGMPYGGEAKIRGSLVPMGSPPDFLAFDPEAPKWGDAEAGKGAPRVESIVRRSSRQAGGPKGPARPKDS